jgi:hypothetical protein
MLDAASHAAASDRSKLPGNARSCPTFVVELRPEPDVDGIRAMRRALKYCRRVCGLRCVSIVEASNEYDPQDDITKSVAEGFRVIRERVCSGGKGWPSD